MDIIAYLETSGSIWTQAVVIPDDAKVTWIERYRVPGEFTIVAPVSSNIDRLLPLGAVISHLDTEQLMIVEDYEIDEDVTDVEPSIVITGRSIDCLLENRSIGAVIDPNGGTAGPLADYILPTAEAHDAAATLIKAHIDDVEIMADPDGIFEDAFLGISVEATNTLAVTLAGAVERIVKRGSLYDRVMELLAVDDFGIKVLRPTKDSPVWSHTRYLIHNGVDRTADVVFSYANGDLSGARYFFTTRGRYTHAHVVSKFNEIRLGAELPSDTMSGVQRKILYVDASDIDSAWNTYPTGLDRDAVLDAMAIRGLDVLYDQRPSGLVSADVSMNTNYRYRRDYDIGDLVRVEGNYGVTGYLRVTEFVEFKDASGVSGYPTLSLV